MGVGVDVDVDFLVPVAEVVEVGAGISKSWGVSVGKKIGVGSGGDSSGAFFLVPKKYEAIPVMPKSINIPKIKEIFFQTEDSENFSGVEA